MLGEIVALGTRLVSALREAAAFSSGQAKHKRPVQDSVIVRRAPANITHRCCTQNASGQR